MGLFVAVSDAVRALFSGDPSIAGSRLTVQAKHVFDRRAVGVSD